MLQLFRRDPLVVEPSVAVECWLTRLFWFALYALNAVESCAIFKMCRHGSTLSWEATSDVAVRLLARLGWRSRLANLLRRGDLVDLVDLATLASALDTLVAVLEDFAEIFVEGTFLFRNMSLSLILSEAHGKFCDSVLVKLVDVCLKLLLETVSKCEFLRTHLQITRCAELLAALVQSADLGVGIVDVLLMGVAIAFGGKLLIAACVPAAEVLDSEVVVDMRLKKA